MTVQEYRALSTQPVTPLVPLEEIPVEEPRETLKREALREINEIRRQRGLPWLSELPKGTKGHPSGCVVANALSGPAQVSCSQNMGIGFWDGDNYDDIPTPAVLCRLITAFDRGEYPELEA